MNVAIAVLVDLESDHLNPVARLGIYCRDRAAHRAGPVDRTVPEAGELDREGSVGLVVVYCFVSYVYLCHVD